MPGFTQTGSNAGPGLPKQPRAILEAAAPFYDFNSPELKPWHLTATYQLYDEKGKPAEQGTYQYWWASPKVHRSTWTRPSSTHTDWLMSDSKYAFESMGDPLSLFEYNLRDALLSPVPGPADLDPAKYYLEDEGIEENGTNGPCLTVVRRMARKAATERPEQGPFPTYCFESQRPILRSVYSFERVLTQFNKIDQTQGRYLAHEVTVVEGKHKLLTAEVDRIEEINSSDPALTPTPAAAFTDLGIARFATSTNLEISKEVMLEFLIKKVEPIYPMAAKRAHIQGNVVLDATIGTDGKVHNLRVVSAPSALLADSSFRAVSQWEYKPYMLKGYSVPVKTTVKVTFALGR